MTVSEKILEALELNEAREMIFKSNDYPPKFMLGKFIFERGEYLIFKAIAKGNNYRAIVQNLPTGKRGSIKKLVDKGVIKPIMIVDNKGYQIADKYIPAARIAGSIKPKVVSTDELTGGVPVGP